MPFRSSVLSRSIAASVAFLSASGVWAASTPDPGDYVPAPAGATVFALYAQHNTADKAYVNGNKVDSNVGLKLDVGVARVMHYFDVAGKRADVEVILPYARQRVSSIGYRESGVGNLQLGATIWPMADEENGRWWGIAAYLTAPTGQKRADGLAVSDDRWALDVETGHIFDLGEFMGGRWSVDLIGVSEFYSTNDSTRVRRDPLLRGIAHLSWQPTQATRFAFSVRQTWGTREKLHGETVLGSKNDTNLMLTWAQQLTDNAQFQLQWAKDVKVRNGEAVRTLQARTVFVF